ncbi:MAG TPA: ribonuclease J, partial [Patescibacteria group bacterium]|nr:ribonuclease J [Patescibacteria group bacterium]
GDPHISTMGLVDPEKPDEMRMVRSLRDEIMDILADMQKNDLKDDHAVQEEIRIGLRRLAVMLWGIKPKATVHIVRV